MNIIDPKNRTQTVLDNTGVTMDKELTEELEEGLLAASEEICRAVKNGDAGGVKEALRAFFEMCDEMPHVEGEHVEHNDAW